MIKVYRNNISARSSVTCTHSLGAPSASGTGTICETSRPEQLLQLPHPQTWRRSSGTTTETPRKNDQPRKKEDFCLPAPWTACGVQPGKKAWNSLQELKASLNRLMAQILLLGRKSTPLTSASRLICIRRSCVYWCWPSAYNSWRSSNITKAAILGLVRSAGGRRALPTPWKPLWIPPGLKV